MRPDLFCASLEDPRVVYALVRMTAEAAPGLGEGPYRDAPAPPPPRRPVNMVLVIDRSSSMRGPRLAQAVLAVRKVTERLDERDRLGVVTFDAVARVLLAPGPVNGEARRRLGAELDRLETGAGTNLGAGWKKGCELAAAGFVREAVARVVLLTDGLPSVGLRSAEKLGLIAEAEAARGITTTAMGIGEAFDDELLGEIARRGHGGFHYLASAEAIPAAFGRELEGVFAIAATHVELKIVPEEHVSSCEVLHRLTARHSADGITVELGEIAQGAPRQVLVRLMRQTPEANRLLAKLAITYKDAGGRDAAHLVRVMSPAVPALGAARSEVSEVALERLRLASAVAVDEAWARRASGHRDQAIAALAEVRSAIAGARDRGLAPRPLLDEISAELHHAEEAIAGAAREAERFRRAARERSHVTLLGQSFVRPLPTDDHADLADGGADDGDVDDVGE
jgi:Ca-activated chloride channel family protein